MSHVEGLPEFGTDHLGIQLVCGHASDTGAWIGWVEGAAGDFRLRWRSIRDARIEEVAQLALDWPPTIAAGGLHGRPTLAWSETAGARMGVAIRSEQGWSLTAIQQSGASGPLVPGSEDQLALLQDVSRLDLTRIWRNPLLRDRSPLVGEFAKPVIARLSGGALEPVSVLDDGGTRQADALAYADGIVAAILKDRGGSSERSVWAAPAERGTYELIGSPGPDARAVTASRDQGGAAHVVFSGHEGLVERRFEDGAWSAPTLVSRRSAAAVGSAAFGDGIAIAASTEPYGDVSVAYGVGASWTPLRSIGSGHVASVTADDNGLLVVWAETTPRTFAEKGRTASDRTWARTAIRAVHLVTNR